MASSSILLPSPFSSSSPVLTRPSPRSLSPTFLPFQLHFTSSVPTLQASRRSSSSPLWNDDELMNGRRTRNRFNFDDYEEEDRDEDEEDEDRSLDLLIKFTENIFKKVSKRARKAFRSILPSTISTKLVGFAVNGLITLSFLWILKAFLQVVCTLGSVVFVSILLVRGVWSGVLFLQENGPNQTNTIENNHPAWTGAEPVT